MLKATNELGLFEENQLEQLRFLHEEVKEQISNLVKESHKSESLISNLEIFLKTEYSTRYNIVTKRVEIKKDKTGFIPLDDYDENSIWLNLQRNGFDCKADFLHRLLASEFSSSFDPFLSYLNSLPKWDGIDYIRLLSETVTTNHQDYWYNCIRKWLIAMVGSLLDEKTINHTVLILIGEGGLGKTHWFNQLIPDKLKNYHYSSSIDPGSKDAKIMLSECMLVVLDELESLTNKKNDSLKSLITNGTIRERRAYGRNNDNYIRRASFGGTGNHMQFISETTGTRRILPFEVTQIIQDHQVPMNKVYSQALHLYRSGERFWFNEEDRVVIYNHNEQFMNVCVEEELLEKYYEPTIRGTGTFMTATDILIDLKGKSNQSLTISRELMGRVLKRKGFKNERKIGTTTSGYYVKAR